MQMMAAGSEPQDYAGYCEWSENLEGKDWLNGMRQAYIQKKFREDTLKPINSVNEILAEYEAGNFVFDSASSPPSTCQPRHYAQPERRFWQALACGYGCPARRFD
jgi:hypothetical protein